MVIHRKERHFLLTVGAYFEIAKYCPDGNIRNLEDVLGADETKAFETIMRMAVAMNKGYNQMCAYNGEQAEEDCLTFDELQSLSPFELPALATEIMASFKNGQQTEIELKEAKKKEL